jgi:integrase
MIRKILTAAAVRQFRPGPERREIPDGGAPGLRLVVHPSGARSWIMRFRRPDGFSAKLTLGTADVVGEESEGEPSIGGHLTLVAARRLAAEVNRQRALGRDPIADLAAQKRMSRIMAGEQTHTFGAAARAFIVEHARPNTRRWRATAAQLGFRVTGDELEPIRGGLAERWVRRPLRDISAHDVFEVLAECRSSGIPGRPRRRPRSSETSARAMYATLSKFFNWLARRPGAIDKNPVSGVERPGTPPARERVVNDNEIRWFWRACGEVGEPFGVLLKLLLITGARREEIAQMTRSEISEDSATWSLSARRTKNGRPHDIPLSPLAREVLAGVTRIVGKPGFIFTTTGSTAVSGFSRVKGRLDKLMIEFALEDGVPVGREPDEVPIPPWRLHDLRRTAVTGMARAGADLHVIERAVNHVSGSFGGVVATYQKHRYALEVRGALDGWATLLSDIVSEIPRANVSRGNIVPLRQGA